MFVVSSHGMEERPGLKVRLDKGPLFIFHFPKHGSDKVTSEMYFYWLKELTSLKRHSKMPHRTEKLHSSAFYMDCSV